ncbi:serpin family protein [Candidatus Albibeggiatoa sp. nov. NOAA]|uniref:serpin family protein n=1 Tax=Candidatus Albibeggiatoa sp. nov. NOAA TaxID=3162724 RepID=UPI0032F155F2|nr:serpin family protein [Thiotrichaceae bacterium]
MLRHIVFTYLVLMMSFTQAAEMQKLVNANGHFALDIYAQLRNQQGNLFFSPYSISTALAMSYAGAKSTTAQQMANTLHFSDIDDVHNAYKKLQSTLNQLQQGGHTKLNTVNAIWYEQTYTVQPTYQALIENNYATPDEIILNKADFHNQAQQVRQQINQWVEAKTQNKIKDLLKPNTIKSDTVAALVNAIYFKSAWLHAFKSSATQKQAFHLDSKQTEQVDMMHQTRSFQYMENDLLQLIELPYQRNDLSMLVLLPKDVQGLDKLEQQLNLKHLASWLSQATTKKIDLSLPKFRTESSFDLVKILQTLGMQDAFDPQKADFTGMIDSADKFAISAVVHKAFIDLDEKGTEAAAATAVVMSRSALMDRQPEPPIEFKADHPFLFLIKDNYTQSILFLGRITNPIQ